jgi:hypothetical protein
VGAGIAPPSAPAAGPHLKVLVRGPELAQRDQAVVLGHAVGPAQDSKHRLDVLQGAPPADDPHHHGAELVERHGAVGQDVLDQLGGGRVDLLGPHVPEAQGVHGELELLAVDGAPAVGVEEVEHLADLRHLRAGQGDLVVLPLGEVPERFDGRPKVVAGVEDAGELSRNEVPEENDLGQPAGSVETLFASAKRF